MSGILVTKPGVLSLGDKAVLREQGIVAVEADSPADVKLIRADGQELSGGSLLYAAVRALNTTHSYASDAREAFAKAIFAELHDEREARAKAAERAAQPPRDNKGRFAKAGGDS